MKRPEIGPDQTIPEYLKMLEPFYEIKKTLKIIEKRPDEDFFVRIALNLIEKYLQQLSEYDDISDEVIDELVSEINELVVNKVPGARLPIPLIPTLTNPRSRNE